MSGGTVAVSLSSRDTKAVIRVADSGRGLSEADLGRIFERFYRVDEKARP